MTLRDGGERTDRGAGFRPCHGAAAHLSGEVQCSNPRIQPRHGWVAARAERQTLMAQIGRLPTVVGSTANVQSRRTPPLPKLRLAKQLFIPSHFLCVLSHTDAFLGILKRLCQRSRYYIVKYQMVIAVLLVPHAALPDDEGGGSDQSPRGLTKH